VAALALGVMPSDGRVQFDPGPSGVISGCYDSGGNLKIVDSSAPCPKGNGEVFASCPDSHPTSPMAARSLRALTQSPGACRPTTASVPSSARSRRGHSTPTEGLALPRTGARSASTPSA